MKVFYTGKDGGPDSTVWGVWLIEWKRLFSVAVLCFEDGSREAFHTHAFHAVSWVLRGRLFEETIDGIGPGSGWHFTEREYPASWRPIVTRRERMHKVASRGRTWVLTFRGPWRQRWTEFLPETQEVVTLTHGRVRVTP